MRSLQASPKCYQSDQIRKDEMGRECSMHNKTWEMRTKFQSENLMGKDHSENMWMDGRKIL
jgi:hypothetical protein